MLQEFKPTHFIEQWNVKDEYLNDRKEEFAFTPVLMLQNFSNIVDYTKNSASLKTVAIFKIQFK